MVESPQGIALPVATARSGLPEHLYSEIAQYADELSIWRMMATSRAIRQAVEQALKLHLAYVTLTGDSVFKEEHDELSTIDPSGDAIRHEYLQHRSQLFSSHIKHYPLCATLLKSLTVEIRDDDIEAGRVHLNRFAGQLETLTLLVIDRDNKSIRDHHGIVIKRQGTGEWENLRFPKLETLTLSATSYILSHLEFMTQEKVLPALGTLNLISESDHSETEYNLVDQMGEMETLDELTVFGHLTGMLTLLENLHVIPNLRYVDIEVEWDPYDYETSPIESSIERCKSLKEQNVYFIPIGQEREFDCKWPDCDPLDDDPLVD